MITKNYAAGDIIITEGEDSDYAYYIQSGTVDVLVHKKDGHMTVAEHGAGDFFGEMGVILEEPRMATFRARTDVQLEVYDIQSFEADIINNAERRNAYLPNLFERIRLMASMLRVAIIPDDEEDADLPQHCYDVHGLVEAREIHELDGDMPNAPSATPQVRFKSVECLEGAAQPVDISVSKFPFNIGRSSSSKIFVENDFYVEDSKPHIVSRGHCAIEQQGETFIVRDRFSACGTILNGEVLGKSTKDFVGQLKRGRNELILGDERSSFRFVIELEA